MPSPRGLKRDLTEGEASPNKLVNYGQATTLGYIADELDDDMDWVPQLQLYTATAVPQCAPRL